MAVTLASLQARIAEAKTALNKDGHHCIRIANSKAQADALAGMVKRCDLNVEETSTFMNVVSDCKFQEADMQILIFAAQKTRANIEPLKQTKLGQNYVAMHVLMNQEQQDMMMSEGRTGDEKAFMMFKLLTAAGL